MRISIPDEAGTSFAASGYSSFDKSIPYGFVFAADKPGKKLNVLEETVHFPLLLLKESALAHNLSAMAEWCAANGFLLAPHGKTTMTPRIFERQMAAGAWGMTVATASQAMVCAELGIPRILIANQVVGRASARTLASLMKEDPALEILCLVDSLETIEFLYAEWEAAGCSRPIGVLVEMGHRGWRTGARSQSAALELAVEVAKHPRALRFRGVEGFEGLAHADDPQEEGREAAALLADIAKIGRSLLDRYAGQDQKLILSAGGTGFLDAIWHFGREVKQNFDVVLRSGCYVTHDHGIYREKVDAARQRGTAANIPQFRPALELWSYVQSRPDDGVAILNFGKRDCAYDSGLPIPLYGLSAPTIGRAQERIDLAQDAVFSTNDQHAYLRGPDVSRLRVGDQVCCGISHPCTAFDKWRAIPLVDDGYNLLDIYKTYF